MVADNRLIKGRANKASTPPVTVRSRRHIEDLGRILNHLIQQSPAALESGRRPMFGKSRKSDSGEMESAGSFTDDPT